MWCQHILGLLTSPKAVLNDLGIEIRIVISASAQIFVGQVKAQKIAIKPFRVG